MSLNGNRISWAQFEVVNEDTTSAFENLSRLLFKHQFFDDNTNFVSKPNHPGVEIFPVFEEKSGKRISFQSKYFLSRVNYTQIQESIRKTIEHHSDDLDIFYLYCNKDINTDSKSYKKCEEILSTANVELKLITNQAILDLVLQNPRISEYFFGQHFLKDEWFAEKLEQSLDSMGARYNKLFNISTRTEKELDLFLTNEETLDIIKEKKNSIIKELRKLIYYLSDEDRILANNILIELYSYEIKDVSKIDDCLLWSTRLQETFSQEFGLLAVRLEKLEVSGDTDDERTTKRIECYRLQKLLDLPQSLEFSKLEQQIITEKILVITGRAGMGKSQLLSEKANKILKIGGHVILLPAHVFITSESIKKQIISYLDLNISFNEFLNVLEIIGELNNEKVYIFIDAINESNNKDIWKIGLSMLFREIEKLSFVKIVISLRSGYEDYVLNDSIKQRIDNYEIPQITHHGFHNNSIEAVRDFFNYYSIPFSPSYFIQSEMTNPLFLTMFCKGYDGNEFDLYHILEKFLEASDIEAQKNIGFLTNNRILSKLLKEITDFHLTNGVHEISEDKLLELNFWNHYGINAKKLPYLSSLTKSGILLSFMSDGQEMYRFGYNLLEDFIYAKSIIERFSSAEDCITFLKEELLKIGVGSRINFQYIDAFVVTTSLFYEKFSKECIDIVDEISDEHIRKRILSEYVKSFSWRPSILIDQSYFRKFINENMIDPTIVFNVLIENSMKEYNPLNAGFLHDILYHKELNERDYLWTTYINGLGNENNRLFQLIIFFDKGNKLETSIEKSWLMLLLFTWCLTSSNRLLRDKASKAIIEVLKTDFSLCLPLLKKFEDVNDPYVIQRLYGVVFGACTKTFDIKKNEVEELVEYVYVTIFDKEQVYPDILLRDYAKLIIEYFIFKFPDFEVDIDLDKITPPYNSAPIPIVEKKEKEYSGGLSLIANSMAPEGVDIMYGDFGRYVFDSALDNFLGVDSINTYNYALSFIENDLGYLNDLFNRYDSIQCFDEYDRHMTNKVERIGKKYQWIAMYNILARVSDYYKLFDRWSDGNELLEYEGSWNPYVRDFDPTLNDNFLCDPNQPIFIKAEETEDNFIERNSSKHAIDDWVNNETDRFFSINSSLMYKDETETEWVALDYYNAIKNTNEEIEASHWDVPGAQDKWVMAKGYFVNKNEFKLLEEDLKNKNFMGRWFPEGTQNTYWLFNREFGWSSAYEELKKNAWLDYKVETGEIKKVKYPSIELPIIDDISEKDDSQLLKHEEYHDMPIRKTLAKVMKAANKFYWEEQYDASQVESTIFDIPCGFLIDDLKLVQKEYDGFYYNEREELVVFYDRENESYNSPHKLLIRKKSLEEFLNRNGLTLFWKCLGEKQFINKKMKDKVWSEWSGLLTLTDEGIIGEVRKHIEEN